MHETTVSHEKPSPFILQKQVPPSIHNEEDMKITFISDWKEGYEGFDLIQIGVREFDDGIRFFFVVVGVGINVYIKI